LISNYSVVGRRIPRVDGVVKATGKAKYTVDMVFPGMLYGKILRSPYPHAKILNIDTKKAEKLRGVRSVITGKDTMGIKYGAEDLPTEDQYPLAIEKVRYIGDEVAAVAAIDEDVAEEALTLIEVDYEKLPAVFDPEEAMRPEAPKIHEVNNNIGWELHWSFGDIDTGLRNSDYIREDRFITQYVTHCAMEPHTSIAIFDPSGYFTIWVSTQNPYWVRRYLAKTLDISEGKVRVIKPYMGGGFGGKVEMLPSYFCSALLSMKTGKPVKIALTREEVFTTTRSRHPMIIELRTGVKRDGILVTSQCRLIADGGAYCSVGPEVIGVAGTFLTGTYRIPNVKYDGYLVYTNKSVCGAQRGFGAPQIRFAFDSQLDIIAEELRIDPVELRLKNVFKSGNITPNGLKITSCGFTECIQRTTKSSDWRTKRVMIKDRGIGIAGSSFVSGAGTLPYNVSGAFIRLHHDGTVTLITGAPDIGQGSDTVLSQIVAEEMGVDICDVKVISADTDTTPIDMGAHASRITFIAGNAARSAAAAAKQQLFEVAAEKLEVSPEDLESRNRWIYVKGSSEKGISIADTIMYSLLKEGKNPTLAKGQYNPGVSNPVEGKANLSPTYSFGAQIAEVQVDKETGQVKLSKMTVAHDCGFAINPMAVEGQLEGSVAGGLGQALLEVLIQKDGQIFNPSFLSYKMPTVMETPEVESILIETIDPEGPFGAKEAGEGTQLSTAPAIANAIYNAIGVRIKDLPITPEKILSRLERKN
jgi:4-hydroxybenzoyl-CoA reductase subunit alpha